MQDFGNIETEHEEMFTKKGIKINAGIYVLENNVENTKEKQKGQINGEKGRRKNKSKRK